MKRTACVMLFASPGCTPRRAAAMAAGFILPLLLTASPAASAQDSDQQRFGMQLFNQSCRVCHTKPQLTSPQYGPVLSMNSLGGQADVMREFISNGTQRMPGFKYHFKPAEIDAIVAYLKTVPAPAAAPTRTKGNAAGDAD
jgi:mono/diheme cytochrome c family protein